MTALLVILCAGVLLYGYALSSRLGPLACDCIPKGQKAAQEVKTILLFGNLKELEPVRQALRKAGISFDMTERAQLDEQFAYQWIGAFSDSDVDNLFLCASAARSISGVKTMALCNDCACRYIFRSAKISHIFYGGVLAKELLSVIGGQFPCF